MKNCSIFCTAGLVLTATICSCSNPTVAGGGTDVGNPAIGGIIVSREGTPVSGAVISLVPKDFNPLRQDISALRKDTTGADGKFLFDSVAVDSPNVVVRSGDTAGCFLPGSDSVVATPLKLGKVKFAKPADFSGTQIALLGSDCVADVAGDSIEFETVPGLYAQMIYSDGSGYKSVEEDVRVVSNKMISLPYTFSVGVYSADPDFPFSDLFSRAGGKVSLVSTVADANGLNLLYIPQGASFSSDVLDSLRDADVPILCAENSALERLGLAPDSIGADQWYSAISSGTDHPILTGICTTYETFDLFLYPYYQYEQLNWGIPTGSAASLLNGVPNQEHSYLFVLDSGKTLSNNEISKNKRGFWGFPHDDLLAKADSITLRTVQWLLGKL